MLPLADQVDELQVHHDRLVLLAELDRCFHIHGAALIAIGRPGLLPAWPPAVVFPFARSPRRAAGPMTPGPGPGRQIASSARSPVRIRTASSTGLTKILPSPMRPVLALFSMASITWWTIWSGTTISSFTFGTKS